jgi:tetratricopeptide (TPR) repeat protein
MLMAEFDQQKQQANQQNNAENIVIHNITFEQYKKHLDEKEQEIRRLLIQLTRTESTEKERAILETQLVDVENKRQNEQDSYTKHIQQLQEQIQRLEPLKAQVPDQLIEQAKVALQTGDNAQADQLFTQIENQAEPHIQAAAEAAYQRGILSEAAINYQVAQNHFERSVQLAPCETTYLNEAGSICHKLGAFQQAMNYWEQALASDLLTYGEDHPNVAIDRNNLGSAYKALGEYERAIAYYEQALASDLLTYGEGHPDVAIDRNNLGSAYYALGEYERAIGYFEQALASDLLTYGEDHPKVATSRNNLGSAYQALGEYARAIAYFEQALASDLLTYGEDHPDVAIRRNNLGGAYQALGKYKRAIAYYEQALSIFEQRLGEDHPNTKAVSANLVIAQAERNSNK